MEVNIPALLGNYGRSIIRLMDRPTDRRRTDIGAQREDVSVDIIYTARRTTCSYNHCVHLVVPLNVFLIIVYAARRTACS